MRLSDLSPEAKVFFSTAFDLSRHCQTAVCRHDNFSGTYPLHYATIKGNIPVMMELIDHGVDVNQLDDSYGNIEVFGSLTPLMRAADGINLEKKKRIIEALLSKNADIHFKNEKNETVLTYAVFIEDINLFEFLLQHGANPFHDTEMANRLKFRLGNLMENKPYQFMRVLRLLANAQEDGSVYLNFEKEFLRMLEKCRAYIESYHQVTTDPQLRRFNAQNPALAQTAGAFPAMPSDTAGAVVPRPPLSYRSREKLLMDIKNGEDMVNAFRMDLDKQSFRAYLEMTSKWVLEQRKLMDLSCDQKTDVKPKIVANKLPSDLEKMLAVQHFGFSYPAVQRQQSALVLRSKRRHDTDEQLSRPMRSNTY